MPEKADPMSALREAAAPADAVEILREAIHAHLCDHNDNEWNDVEVAKAILTPWVRAALRASLAPETDRDAERIRREVVEAVEEADRDRTEEEGGIDAEAIGNIVYSVLTAPSLEGARHPEAGDEEERR